jgi:hypothetical protein
LALKDSVIGARGMTEAVNTAITQDIGQQGLDIGDLVGRDRTA